MRGVDPLLDIDVSTHCYTNFVCTMEVDHVLENIEANPTEQVRLCDNISDNSIYVDKIVWLIIASSIQWQSMKKNVKDVEIVYAKAKVHDGFDFLYTIKVGFKTYLISIEVDEDRLFMHFKLAPVRGVEKIRNFCMSRGDMLKPGVGVNLEHLISKAITYEQYYQPGNSIIDYVSAELMEFMQRAF